MLREKQTGECVEGETDWSMFLGRNTLDSVLREKQFGQYF